MQMAGLRCVSGPPAPRLHPAQQRLERHDPHDPRDDIDQRLRQRMQRADRGREAGDQHRPQHDQYDDEERADGLSPGGVHRGGVLSRNPVSVTMPASGRSQGSTGSTATRCTSHAMPIGHASGKPVSARS